MKTSETMPRKAPTSSGFERGIMLRTAFFESSRLLGVTAKIRGSGAGAFAALGAAGAVGTDGCVPGAAGAEGREAGTAGAPLTKPSKGARWGS